MGGVGFVYGVLGLIKEGEMKEKEIEVKRKMKMKIVLVS